MFPCCFLGPDNESHHLQSPRPKMKKMKRPSRWLQQEKNQRKNDRKRMWRYDFVFLGHAKPYTPSDFQSDEDEEGSDWEESTSEESELEDLAGKKLEELRLFFLK